MMRLQSNLDELCLAAINGELDKQQIQWDEKTCLGVVLAEKGYPESYRTGSIITGIEQGSREDDWKIFHAGTKIEHNKLVTNGGRVLCVCALGKNIKQAQTKAYQHANAITWDSKYCRFDIGYKAL
jgi:phosphoribosylamine--glycine ligase